MNWSKVIEDLNASSTEAAETARTAASTMEKTCAYNVAITLSGLAKALAKGLEEGK